MQRLSAAILLATCSISFMHVLPVAASPATNAQVHYRITLLPSLGGTNSRGNSINNLGLVAGYSKISGNAVRHATLWLFGAKHDLGTLGDPATTNSGVLWPVKNLIGIVSGISETGAHNPLNESWSCAGFFATFGKGNVCRGFVWEWGTMRELPPLPGGYNSFATGTNNFAQTVGWAENGFHDPACAADSDQKLQFKPVVWGPGHGRTHELPLVGTDTSGAATALNDRGQVVGISGTCDQAVGRRTATHAVLWENGAVIDIGNIGAPLWNTPTAINQRGDIAGFAGTQADDLDGNFTHAFVRLAGKPMQDIGVLDGDSSSTSGGINESSQVAGYSCADVCRAFVWQNGKMSDLNDLADGYVGTKKLVLAEDINDLGQITGRAIDSNGALVPFIATPIR